MTYRAAYRSKRPELIGVRTADYVGTDRERGWMDDARCRQPGYDPELWFPVSQASQSHAYAVCAGCPVIRRCLDYAWTNGIVWGIWGGMTADERAKYKRTQGLPLHLMQLIGADATAALLAGETRALESINE